MESHILNSYHQARFRSIGHKLLRTDPPSQNRPEYAKPTYQYWDKTAWGQGQTINMTRSQDSSSEEEENIDVQELVYDDHSENAVSEPDTAEEQVLVEGDDYDIIQVYAVDPDLDLEASSDDENEDYVINNNVKVKTEPLAEDERDIDTLINFDTPVVSNVDEYFIKDNDKDILAVKDEPVVTDVDEYFIKEEKPKTPNVDDFFVKDKDDNETEAVNVDEFFVDAKSVEVAEKTVVDQNIDQNDIDNAEVPINESDLEVLPNIEELKRFLLEDMSYSKFKSLQRSCSLPQSPMHNICLDIDDAKTCLSFEDLNLDLSDLSFDNDKVKSANSSKSDDLPRTLTDEDVNSFLITAKNEPKVAVDDLSHQDMEIDHPVESIIDPIVVPKPESKPKVKEVKTSTPIKSTVLNFCIEKSATKKFGEKDPDDFVDVESCNDVVIPLLEANNLNSLLEQFEATEKLNSKPKKLIKNDEQKCKSLTNGMRLQDAGVQLNKTKMRQILMPPTVSAPARRSPSPVHSDHDYCSSKKRYSLPNIKGGQSLLKPEVLATNRILTSRHRSCKNKKVVYALSSDDESERNNKNKKTSDDNDAKLKKTNVKQTVKVIPQPARKKPSPVHSADHKESSNNSVILKDACKASDTLSSQNSNCSIKLTIKNKSEVILNCDVKDSQKDKPIDKCKSSVSEKEIKVKVDQNNIKNKSIKNIKEVVDSNIKKISVDCNDVAKDEGRPKEEHFYTALFSNKEDVQMPQTMQAKSEKRSFEEEISILTNIPKGETDKPQKKKKLNLQEYKMRKCVNSNNSSATVSPEAIFPDMPSPFTNDRTPKCTPNQTPPNGIVNTEHTIEAPKKIFDPIREASRKILMNTKKQKAEAMRKRDEDIVMSKIPKVDNLELQPLISDAEMMKIVGMAPAEALPAPVVEKPQVPADYEEIVMFSVGTNTDEKVFKEMETFARKQKSQSPADKSLINFKIKKSEHVLKQNVFDVKRDKKSPVDEKKADVKIDRARFKDITATLKSVEKQVDPKISSNSLFASIQDTVMKKAPDEINEKKKERSKSNSPKRQVKCVRPTIIRDYDVKAEHGEDKIILHLGKDRNKPDVSTSITQTDTDAENAEIVITEVKQKTPPRKRNDSDMSFSSEGSPVRKNTKAIVKKDRHIHSQSKEKRSRSRDRYDKYRRSRSLSRSRSRRRRRSLSRSRSRSRGRYRRYRRSDSPYRRKRRSHSSYRRSSSRREYRQSRSRAERSKSPRRKTPQREEKKCVKSLTPPPRKPTVSESSDSSTSSSSSSSSSDGSRDSRKSRTPCRQSRTPCRQSRSKSRQSRSPCRDSRSPSRQSRSPCRPSRSPGSPYRNEYRKKVYASYSSDRESNTPVEERRIVFVGKLEKDITKLSLRSQFSKFGPVMEVRLHTKEDGSRYGFVTYQRARDAWSAVEAAATFPRYDVGFGGRRAFCRQTYADLDGLEAKYTESVFHGAAPPPARPQHDMSFEQMLHEMKKKMQMRKKDDKP